MVRFAHQMPSSRPADYCFGWMDGSVFIDFIIDPQNRILLKRISFDGYGCCELDNDPVPLESDDSDRFRTMLNNGQLHDPAFELLIQKAIDLNRWQVWEDALKEYGL
jgi:hypothetical protein